MTITAPTAESIGFNNSVRRNFKQLDEELGRAHSAHMNLSAKVKELFTANAELRANNEDLRQSLKDQAADFRALLAESRAATVDAIDSKVDRAVGIAARDAAQREVEMAMRDSAQVPEAWSASRSYKQGEECLHRSGLWVARCSTSAEPVAGGDWSCSAAGIDRIDLRTVDARNHELVIERSDGSKQTLSLHTPALLHRGVWAESADYEIGDVVIDAGSLWVLRTKQQGKPGQAASGWQLSAKRGANGKDGRDAPSNPPPSMRYYRAWNDFALCGDLVEHDSQLWLALKQGVEAPPTRASGMIRTDSWRLIA